MTAPVKPPSDIRWQCVADATEHNNWTSAWNHMLDEHSGVSPAWTLLGTVPEE